MANSVKHVAFDPKQVTGLADGRWTGACVRKRVPDALPTLPLLSSLALVSGRLFLNGLEFACMACIPNGRDVRDRYSLSQSTFRESLFSKEGDWKQHCIVE